MEYKLPGVKIGSTKDTLGPDSKMAMLVWSASGRGKTYLAGSLHRLTMKHFQKPTLYIAVEAGEGGGAVSIRNMDVPLYIPKDLSELRATLSALKNDRQFGGAVLDSATELTKAYIKPVALKFPCREKSAVVVAPRDAGVPTKSDYQSMGELTRQVFQDLLNLSAHPDPALRKHIIVTALERTREDEDGKMIFWGPDLPGAMGPGAAGMFQVNGTIDIKSEVVDGKRFARRYLITTAEGVKSLKDRTKVLPASVPLKGPDGGGLDLCDMWEQYWMPEIERVTKEEVKGNGAN